MSATQEETDYFWGTLDGVKATYNIPTNQGVVINCGADLNVTIERPYAL